MRIGDCWGLYGGLECRDYYEKLRCLKRRDGTHDAWRKAGETKSRHKWSQEDSLAVVLKAGRVLRLP